MDIIRNFNIIRNFIIRNGYNLYKNASTNILINENKQEDTGVVIISFLQNKIKYRIILIYV